MVLVREGTVNTRDSVAKNTRPLIPLRRSKMGKVTDVWSADYQRLREVARRLTSTR